MNEPERITDLPVTDRGDWLATSRGGMWSIDHPAPQDVFLEDLICGMSRTCRYGGQFVRGAPFYSVAEHSRLMTEWAIAEGRVAHLEDALAIMLHDASEAYYGDIPTPLKRRLPAYAILEKQAQEVIMEAFGLNPGNTLITKAEIKEIDIRIRVDEREAIIKEPARTQGRELMWERDGLVPQPALGVNIECQLPDQAAEGFTWLLREMAVKLPARDPATFRSLMQQLATMEFEAKIAAEPDEVFEPA